MTQPTKEELLEFIRNNTFDVDDVYPANHCCTYKKQRDELIKDIALLRKQMEDK